MSDRDALLAAVLAHPDEDTPRLAYADWLDETGEDPARAEFIRLQIGLPAMIEADAPDWPAVSAARKRVAELERAHERRWSGPTNCLARYDEIKWYFDRGFVTSIDAIKCSDDDPGGFMDMVGAALAEHHIETVQFCDITSVRLATNYFLSEMAGWPQAGNIRELDIFDDRTPANTTLLANNPHLRRLTRLKLRGDVWAADLYDLKNLAAPLTDLEVATSSEEAGGWCAALGELLAATAVTRLVVQTKGLHDAWLPRVLDAVSGSRVSDLTLWFYTDGVSDLTAFARCPHAGRLAALSLFHSGYTPAQFVRLFADADFRSLRKFHTTPLGESVMADAGGAWAALLAAPFAERLTDLDVSGWVLAGADFGPLARGSLPNLRDLSLYETGCGDAAVEAIAGAAFAPQLRTLGLPNCGLTDCGAEALLAADFPRLGQLVLSGSGLGDGVKSRLRDRFGDRVDIW